MPRRRGDSDESSDDEDEYARKRRRTTSETFEIEDRLESLITRIGEKSSSSLESNLEGLAAVLENDLANYKSKILKILLECAITMPERLTVYTTLIGLLNAKSYNAGGEFVELLARHMKEALRNGEYDEVRLMVRFFADLVNCRVVSAVSIMVLFNTFVDVINEDQIPQVRSDCYISIVMSALPWVGLELFNKKEKELDKLMDSIGQYIDGTLPCVLGWHCIIIRSRNGKILILLEKGRSRQGRQKIHVAMLRTWSTDTISPHVESIDSLWVQLQTMRKGQWVEHHISRPYLAFHGVLNDALQHSIPTIVLPGHCRENRYPIPTVVFRMFDYSDVPEGMPQLPQHESIDRYLIHEQLDHLIHKHHIDRKLCAESLLSIPKKSELPLNYLIIETLFAQLFNLPRPPYVEIFYGSLLIELCKLQPSSMPQVLAQATEILYDRLDNMNTACIERFCNWFSYHLSNFQFKWSWEDWNDCLAMNLEKAKPKFVRETLTKCLRLSYHQRVVEIVPESFSSLLPDVPKPHYKYEQEGAGSLPGTMVAHKLLQAIKGKCTVDDAEEILRELPNPRHSSEGYNPLMIEVFVPTLLSLATKSFSHSFAAISKFHSLLRSLGTGSDSKSSDEAQICILHSLFELWKTNQQMLVVIIDKLLKTQVIRCQAVAGWIFSSEMSSEFTKFYVWEILNATIIKMNKQVLQLQKQIDEMHHKLELHERKRIEGFPSSSDDPMEGSVPTESDIEKEEERLKDMQSAQKNLFLVIFQRLIAILSDHLSDCESNRKNFNTPWYKWAIERLQLVFILHHEQVFNYIATLETLLFTSDVDARILEVFQQFCALRQ